MARLVSFNVDSTQIDAMLKRMNSFQKKQVPKAINRALNRVGTTVRKEAVREVSQATGLKQKDVRPAIILLKSSFSTLSAVVRSVGRHLNVIRFGARQTRKGVTAKPWGVKRLYKSAFIANQGRTVFIRKGKARLPIKAVWGPSIPREFIEKKLVAIYNRVVKTRFPVEFGRDLRARLNRAIRK